MKLPVFRQNDGFVSLLACIMISLLLLVITVSMVMLETLQLRKASDSEQSLRAYYTAEAGVEDAVSKVLSKTVTTNQSCTSNINYDTPGAAGWTCQQITFSGTPTGKLDEPDVAKTVDPGPASDPYQSVVLEWDQTTQPAAYYSFPTGALPNAAAGGAKSSPIELAIVQYPRTTFAADNPNLNLKNFLFVPGGTAGVTNAAYPGASTSGPVRASCNAARANYRCTLTLSGFDVNMAYLFRIRPRYGASAYKMTFYSGSNGTGTIRQVPDGTATIDVTARAGETYRRTVSKLPLNNSAASRLNFVMYSDTNVCKAFEVIDNTFPSPTGCTP